MNLDLAPDEVEILRELVAQSIRELGPEIHHTDSRKYRGQLDQRLKSLESLAARLEAAPAATMRL